MTDAGEMDATGVAIAAPVPLRATLCGLPVALSVIWSWAERAPTNVGVNVTLMVQVAAAARVLPHAFDSANSEASAPEMTMLVSVRAALPVLLRVTAFAVLVVLTV